jgi:hypothetical protein
MDTLILDIGGDIGALVLHAGPELAEREIEISAGPDAPRSHNVVHARTGRDRIAYTAVFPSVPAGEYTVWHGASPATVTIRGGEVTEHYL